MCNRAIVAVLAASVYVHAPFQPIAFALAAQYRVIWDPSAHSSFDALGNIYSVLAVDNAGDLYGEGVGDPGQVFALEPTQGPGTWKGKAIYRFYAAGAPPGDNPYGGVTIAHDIIFGTNTDAPLISGGFAGIGTIFRLDHPPALTMDDLHIFQGAGATPHDGALPQSGLTFGLHGLLYGTTEFGGGARNAGTVFAVSQSETNPAYAVIHRFGRAGDGALPQLGRLAVDGLGRLYGTTSAGGADHAGSVFMMENTGGVWREQVLYSFQPINDLERDDFRLVHIQLS